MSTNNKVFNVLVTKGNQALPAVGTAVTALALNQIGVFDSNTDLAINGSNPVKDFYLAVGRDRSGNGTVDDIDISAGQMIQTKNVNNFTFRPHTAGRPMIFEFKGYTANCDTEYGIRLELRNMAVYKRQGYVQFSKPYVITTPCCAGCEGCPSGDANDISILLSKAVNADPLSLVKAEIIARTAIVAATHGTSADYAVGAVVTEADAEKLKTYNASGVAANLKRFTDLRFTTSNLAIEKYCSVNLNYKKPRFTIVIPSKIQGFECTGTLTTTQTAVPEEGDAYDVKQKEYHAGGWNGNPGPYKTSLSTGVAANINYNAEDGIKYDQFHIVYDQFSVSGWQEHLNNLMTIIAIPATDTVTRNALAGVLDAQFAALGFDALADDAASANVSPTAVEETSSKTSATDGIA